MAKIFVKGYTKKDGTKVAGYYKEVKKTGEYYIRTPKVLGGERILLQKDNEYFRNKKNKTKRITSIIFNKKKKKHQGFYDFKKYIQKGGRIWD